MINIRKRISVVNTPGPIIHDVELCGRKERGKKDRYRARVKHRWHLFVFL